MKKRVLYLSAFSAVIVSLIAVPPALYAEDPDPGYPRLPWDGQTLSRGYTQGDPVQRDIPYFFYGTNPPVAEVPVVFWGYVQVTPGGDRTARGTVQQDQEYFQDADSGEQNFYSHYDVDNVTDGYYRLEWLDGSTGGGTAYMSIYAEED
ncbi:MAG: hypothetical protein MAG453_02043 [Calditrichaeota bacterium]|nr:hypothetical protein [Calditrichota bacterium]